MAKIKKSQSDSETQLLIVCIGQGGAGHDEGSLAKRIKQITILVPSCFFLSCGMKVFEYKWHPTVKMKSSLLQGGSFSKGFFNVPGCFCQGACIVPPKQKRCFSSVWPIAGLTHRPRVQLRTWMESCVASSHAPPHSHVAKPNCFDESWRTGYVKTDWVCFYPLKGAPKTAELSLKHIVRCPRQKSKK